MIITRNGAALHRDALREELRRRMSRPQRHRLLQGYPMAPLMHLTPNGFDAFSSVELDPSRPLIIGVLPHTFCNPRVRGCGFCTFPHERFAREPMRRVLEHVAREIEQTAAREPSLRERYVEAVYFGGGTANLTPPEELERLCRLLGSIFDLSRSELTLEGAPKYFLLREEALLDVLERCNVRHRRISMGVQTFDPQWLQRMGRDAFGDRDDIQQVVDAAHRRGMTASADLLFNLPGASLDHALADVRSAIDIGFDQICAYNLVLSPDLGTEWARETALVRAMPDRAHAMTTWVAVRRTLLDGGYVQTTLTNFERAEIVQTSRRFVYELASFRPARCDAIGFGPAAISTFTSRDHRSASKWVNAGSSEAFVERMAERKSAVASAFDYEVTDLRLLHLTRNLARLSIDNAEYETFFGEDPFREFSTHLDVLENAGLVRDEGGTIEVTPEGMFYADAVAGLFAYRRIAELRQHEDANLATRHHMG